MSQIHVLPPHLADLIAAGEVVERPASAIKELVENAIDAGASKISVSIAAGGMEYITVTDDGCGMSPDDAVTAFLRHATSKIRSESDLEAIGTLGFRGEALAAISSVSKSECLTRRPADDMGWSVRLEAGEITDSQEMGAPVGTTISVRHLFYNTPARRKFLKKDTYEAAACLQTVQRIALSHPEISFKFSRDGKPELLTPGNGSTEHAIEAVLGRELVLGLLPVASSDEGELSVSGFVSKPVCCRGSRSHQYLFLNGRHIKSRALTVAVEQAYANQKTVGKFPAFLLYLTAKPSFVDCNVHPTKVEVKFADERRVFSLIFHAVESALNSVSAAPAQIAKPAVHDTVTRNQTAFRTMTADEYRILPSEQRAPLQRVGDSGSRRGTMPTPTPSAKVLTPSDVIPSRQQGSGSFSSPVSASEPVAPQQGVPLAEAEPSTPAAPVAPEEELPDYLLRGEAFHTYIIIEQGDKLLFIDKHAAHERMNFDRMKAQDWRPMIQQLLAPIAVRLSPEQTAAMLEHLPLVEEFGFSLEDFGAGMLRVTAAPHDIDAADFGDTLADLADTLLENGDADPAAARDEMLHTMACKAAIKGGWDTTEAELRAVAERVLSGEVRYCPHGRPVAFEMTRGELEKRFKR